MMAEEGQRLDSPVAPATKPLAKQVWDKAGWLLFSSSPAVLLLAVVGLSILKNGIDSIPLGSSLVLDHTLHATGNPRSDYLLGSPIDLGLAHMLGWTSASLFILEHVLALGAFLVVLTWGAYRKGGRFGVGVAVLVLFTSTLSNIELVSIGLSDPFTLLFLTIVVLAEQPLVAALAGVGLGLSHAEIGWFAVLSIASFCRLRHERLRPIAWAVVGLAAGTICTLLFDVHAGVGLDPRGTFIKDFGVISFLDEWVPQVPTLVFASFGVFWAAVVLLRKHWAPTRQLLDVGLLVFAVALAITVLTEDQSRILGLLLWGPQLWLALRLPRDDSRVRKVLLATFLAAIAMPRLYIFEGLPYTSSLGNVPHLF
jgi:hypothetical protein